MTVLRFNSQHFQALGIMMLSVLLGYSSVQRVSSKPAPSYNPLQIAPDASNSAIELKVEDSSRNRTIPLRVYLPSSTAVMPVVLFSHGLGGNREGSAYLGQHWAKRGYVAVFLQHPGSDDAVWRGKPLLQRQAALREAASPENFLLRVKDVSVVLDQLQRWNRRDRSELIGQRNPLQGRLNLSRVGMSGHSFGAATTQAVSGQSFPVKGTSFSDPRITAALPISPSSPQQGSPAAAFGSVKIPWMVMTGTEDHSPITNADATSRLQVYANLPNRCKYELVLYNAEHSAFTDARLPGDRQPRNPNHHRAIQALSTAFWDTYLKNDLKARAWVDGKEVRSVLEPKDKWQSQPCPL
jgi:predicted dienelactone hydrolase